MTKKTELIVALDYESPDAAMRLVESTVEHVKWFKVGSQLFTSDGPDILRRIKNAGGRIFLDLKFHDIPNTVAKSVESAARHSVDMLNVHASGGREMMRAALDSARAKRPEMRLIAVTVLTSMDDAKLASAINAPCGYKAGTHVLHLANLAKEAGLDGVVASAHEIDMIRKSCGESFCLVIPGIRPAFSSKDDQERIMTPKEASDKGADFIVVGRPVTAAKNPSETALRILEELSP